MPTWFKTKINGEKTTTGTWVLKVVGKDRFNTTTVESRMVMLPGPILLVAKIKHRGVMELAQSHTACQCQNSDGLCLAHWAVLSATVMIYCPFHSLRQLHTRMARSWSRTSQHCYRYCSVNLFSLTLQGERGSFHYYWFAPLLGDVLSSEEKGKTKGKDSIISTLALSGAWGKGLHITKLQM